MTPSRPAPHSWRTWTGWALALLVLHAAFVFPHRVAAADLSALLHIPVELPATVLILGLLPAALWPVLRPVLTAVLCLLVLMKLADLVADISLARPFNPLLDLHLAASGLEVLSGAVGPAIAAGLIVGVAVPWLAALAMLYWALGRLRPQEGARRRLAAGAALVTAAIGAIHLLGPEDEPPVATTAAASQLVRDKAVLLRDSLADRARFRAELEEDSISDVPSERLFNRLRDTDVLMLFVESYGRSALEDPRYASALHDLLNAFEETAESAGYEARSGWLTAPTFGGRSWLSHGTLHSGLRLDNQRRYESLIVSDRETLVSDFNRAGWRTLAVMPAIIRPWPEARFFQFDRIYVAEDLDYAGAPFNWVTMPDQFTMAALQRLEIAARERPPIMATVALISSHAPWTPIPPVLEWDEIGDGSVFTPYAERGDPPNVVWRDPDRVRQQYLRSIDYVLRTLESYVAAYGGDDTLFVIVGDHQPGRIVTGDDGSHDVPIHILSRDPDVMAAIADWGWSPGMRPDDTAPVWPMEGVRERLVRAFTAEDAPAGREAAATDEASR